MKIKELNELIESAIIDEIKKALINEEESDKKEVYHITCEGEPVATFNSQEEAESHLDIYKKEHPGKQFIIEKSKYDSHSDMIDKLDNMGEELEEKETPNMKNIKVNEEMSEEQYWNEEEGQCDECGDSQMGEQEDYDILGSKHEFETYFDDEDGKNSDDDSYDGPDETFMDDDSDNYDNESRHDLGNEEPKEMEEHAPDGDSQYHRLEEHGMCNECGGPLNEEGVCNECMGNGKIWESKNKTVRIKESEFVKIIDKMVSEAMKGQPGISGIPGKTVTKRVQDASKKENDDYLGDVEKKMKKYLSFDGNDNPEFPKQIGKGEKVAYKNTDKQDEETARNFAGLENLDYDLEPSEQFKKRLKMSIEGDSLMGNAPKTEKASIKPSNGAEKGEESEHPNGNAIETPETSKKIKQQMKDRAEDKKNRVLYPKEKVPVNDKKVPEVNESKGKLTSILNEEIERMKKISNYNKKTQ
jgi:hypothetical protein